MSIPSRFGWKLRKTIEPLMNEPRSFLTSTATTSFACNTNMASTAALRASHILTLMRRLEDAAGYDAAHRSARARCASTCCAGGDRATFRPANRDERTRCQTSASMCIECRLQKIDVIPHGVP